MSTKFCRWCEKTKPLDQFHLHKQMKDGRLNKCAECVRAYVRNHHRENPLRKVWQHMMDRCSNPAHKSWHRYGGRGIAVCERWQTFEHFRADMKPSYKAGLQLDRIDNDGSYSPENCRWVTASRNARNRCSTRTVTAKGKTQCIKAWSEETGISAATISARLRRLGWDEERAVTQPLRRQRSRS